ncbi:hypothetical protein BS78_01G130000 [Paspalum vaginatum]|nr:hypothetical protein BS78_01G130000 [Paspalum vaginatum]
MRLTLDRLERKETEGHPHPPAPDPLPATLVLPRPSCRRPPTRPRPARRRPSSRVPRAAHPPAAGRPPAPLLPPLPCAAVTRAAVGRLSPAPSQPFLLMLARNPSCAPAFFRASPLSRSPPCSRETISSKGKGYCEGSEIENPQTEEVRSKMSNFERI